MTSIAAERLPITVVILTKNEAEVVARAIASAQQDYSEVIVVDSYSDDGTVEVARAAGATVVQHAFTGYASQRNFALKELSKANDWILFVDSDEVICPDVTAELRREFQRLVSEGFGMAYLRRKDYFMGRWIKRSSGYPTWFGRLCHAPSVIVTREINEQYCCSRPAARLSGHLLHYPFAKGLANWVDRHNRYSTAEAIEKARDSREEPLLVLSRDPGLARKALKSIYMRLPFRPLVAFLGLYAIRGGFVDGRAGLHYALLRAMYEFLIDAKVREIRAASRTEPGRP